MKNPKSDCLEVNKQNAVACVLQQVAFILYIGLTAFEFAV